MPREHKYTTKIYYEDTDAGGVVYYANYFKFIERARSEMIYDLLSINLSDLKRDFDILFVVKKLTAEFHKPIKFEDKIDVITNIIRKTPVRLSLKQVIKKQEDLMFISEVELAVISPKGAVKKLTTELFSKIK